MSEEEETLEIVGSLKVKKCWDGSIVAIYKRGVGDMWILTGLDCPPRPPK